MDARARRRLHSIRFARRRPPKGRQGASCGHRKSDSEEGNSGEQHAERGSDPSRCALSARDLNELGATMWQMGVGYANGRLHWVSHRASIRDNDQAGWRSVRQRLIVLQLHQGCSRGLHDPAGHRRSVGGRAGDVGCVLEARAVRLPAGRSSVWCVAASNGSGSHVRVPLRRAQMGRAAASAAPPLGSDWSSCSCRSCRAAASLTWVVRGRRCGLGLSCSCGGPGWAAAAHVDRPKRDQEGGSALFWDS